MVDWEVTYKNDVVMHFRDEPGFVGSSLLRPPPSEPQEVMKHPFISGGLSSFAHEWRISGILAVSSNPDDFRTRLRKAGFKVRKED